MEEKEKEREEQGWLPLLRLVHKMQILCLHFLLVSLIPAGMDAQSAKIMHVYRCAYRDGGGAMNVEKPPEDFSVFEALRDTIYSEVATLIANNENRPHFLVSPSC